MEAKWINVLAVPIDEVWMRCSNCNTDFAIKDVSKRTDKDNDEILKECPICKANMNKIDWDKIKNDNKEAFVGIQ